MRPDTHQRLLDAATRMFAEHGFGQVTVRQIAQEAGANIAAVSYHFGDKLGLYLAVVQEAVGMMRMALDEATLKTKNASGAERLRFYVKTYLRHLTADQEPNAWIHRIMRHEMSEPTLAAPFIINEAIRPRILYLRGVVADVLDVKPSDPRVGDCVMSIQSQCLSFLPNALAALLLGAWPPPAAAIEAAADHIVNFSMGGIAAVKSKRTTAPRVTTPTTAPR